MQDESMKNFDGALEEVRRMEAALDARVVAALERVPAAEVPADFAARVAGLVPVRRVVEGVRATWVGYGVMGVCAVVLLVAMVWVAGLKGHGAVWVEWTLCGEFVGLVMWLSVWRGRLT